MLMRSVFQFAVPIVMSAGTFGYILLFPLFGGPWDIIAGAITGITSAAIAARWVYEFSGVEMEDLIVNLPMLLVVAAVFCLTMLYLAYQILICLIVILPLFTGLQLSLTHKYRGKDIDEEKSVVPHQWRGYLYVIIVVGDIGFAGGFFNTASEGSQAAYTFASALNLLMVFVLLLATGVYIYCHRREVFFQALILPLIVLLLLIIPSSSEIVGSPSIAFISLGEDFGEIGLEMALLVLSAIYARYMRISAVRTFVIARISMAASDLFGYMVLPSWGISVSAMSWTDLLVVFSVLLFIAVVGISLLAAFLVYRKDFSRWGSRNAENADDNEEPGLDSSLTEAKDRDESSRHMRCISIQNEYGLSDREEDVLELLSRGYSSMAIQDKLCIASGTVNSHTRNIYSKLNIHSKGELIELVDNWEVEGR